MKNTKALIKEFFTICSYWLLANQGTIMDNKVHKVFLIDSHVLHMNSFFVLEMEIWVDGLEELRKEGASTKQ